MDVGKALAISVVGICASLGLIGMVDMADFKPVQTHAEKEANHTIPALIGASYGYRAIPEEFIKRAEDLDDPQLYYFIGEILEQGLHGVKPNEEDALVWYERAAQKNHKEAIYKLGLSASKLNFFGAQEEAFNLFKRSADMGYAPAQLEYANMLLEGFVRDANPGKAKHYYELAANQGLADAELNLGLMYQKGISVKADPTTAMSYYNSAAIKGQTQAQFNLGVAYYYGYGVEKDLWASKEWLNKAFLAGNKDALVIMNKIQVL